MDWLNFVERFGLPVVLLGASWHHFLKEQKRWRSTDAAKDKVIDHHVKMRLSEGSECAEAKGRDNVVLHQVIGAQGDMMGKSVEVMRELKITLDAREGGPRGGNS